MTISCRLPSRNKIFASDPFAVPGQGGNLRLDVSTTLNNNWLGLNLSLVGDGGTPVFNDSRTVGYYSGYDSDGRWTEGSQDARIMFRSIPGGNYRLLVAADAGVFARRAPATGQPPEPSIAFTIAARRHAPAPEFFWIALLLMLPYPVYRLFFKRGQSR